MAPIAIPRNLHMGIMNCKNDKEKMRAFITQVARMTFIQTSRLMVGLYQVIGKNLDYSDIYQIFKDIVDEHKSATTSITEIGTMAELSGLMTASKSGITNNDKN